MLKAIINSRLEEIEGKIEEIRGYIEKPGTNAPDIRLYVKEPEPEYGEPPVIISFMGRIAAGKLIPASDAQSAVSVPGRFIKGSPENYYALQIEGASMTAAGIQDRAQVLIRKSDAARHGAIQVVEHKGEVSLKRLREIPGIGWEICHDDNTGQRVLIGPEDEFHVQGDFVAILPEG